MKKSEAGSTGRRFDDATINYTDIALKRDYSNERLLFAIENIGLIFVHAFPAYSFVDVTFPSSSIIYTSHAVSEIANKFSAGKIAFSIGTR